MAVLALLFWTFLIGYFIYLRYKSKKLNCQLTVFKKLDASKNMRFTSEGWAFVYDDDTNKKC